MGNITWYQMIIADKNRQHYSLVCIAEFTTREGYGPEIQREDVGRRQQLPLPAALACSPHPRRPHCHAACECLLSNASSTQTPLSCCMWVSMSNASSTPTPLSCCMWVSMSNASSTPTPLSCCMWVSVPHPRQPHCHAACECLLSNASSTPTPLSCCMWVSTV